MAGSVSSASEELPQSPWFARGSRHRLRLLTAGLFVLVFVINLVLDFAVGRLARSPTIGYIVSDGVAALIAALLLQRVITLTYERRRAVRHRLMVIAEMNHHIRNALDAIQMSAQMTRDCAAMNVISDEVNRIQWALREVLGGEEEP